MVRKKDHYFKSAVSSLDWIRVNKIKSEIKWSSIYKKGCKEDLGNYRSVSLTSVPGEVMKQITLGDITRHMRGIQGIRPSQHGVMKGSSFLTNFISLYDWVTRLVDEGKAVNVVHLDFSKDFDMVSHSILL